MRKGAAVGVCGGRIPFYVRAEIGKRGFIVPQEKESLMQSDPGCYKTTTVSTPHPPRGGGQNGGESLHSCRQIPLAHLFPHMRPIFYSPAPPPRPANTLPEGIQPKKNGGSPKKIPCVTAHVDVPGIYRWPDRFNQPPTQVDVRAEGSLPRVSSPTAAIPLARPQYLEYSPEGEGRGIGEALIGSDVGSKFLEPGGGLRIEEEGEEEGAKLPFPHTPPSISLDPSRFFFIHVRLPLS